MSIEFAIILSVKRYLRAPACAVFKFQPYTFKCMWPLVKQNVTQTIGNKIIDCYMR